MMLVMFWLFSKNGANSYNRIYSFGFSFKAACRKLYPFSNCPSVNDIRGYSVENSSIFIMVLNVGH